MKLRIRGNSIRLRLSQSEIVQIKTSGLIEERVELGFPNQQIVYALEFEENSKQVKATFENNRLCISVPKSESNIWTNSDQISIEAQQLIENDMFLRILIEKDFACLEVREGEDDAESFSTSFERTAMLNSEPL